MRPKWELIEAATTLTALRWEGVRTPSDRSSRALFEALCREVQAIDPVSGHRKANEPRGRGVMIGNPEPHLKAAEPSEGSGWSAVETAGIMKEKDTL